MRSLIVTALLASVALVGCKKKTPGVPVSDQSDTPSMKQAPLTGSKAVAGLERAAFVPADAIAYGSFDSQRLLKAAQPIVLLFFQMRARSSGSRPKPVVLVNGTPRSKPKAGRASPRLTYPMLKALAKRKYGLDADKLGRVTVIGVVPSPQRNNRPAFFGEPVFLAPSAAYAPGHSKPVETIGGVQLYAVAGRPTRSRIAVVGETIIFGETNPVKRVLAVRLGKAPRLGDISPLLRSVRSLRATRREVSSFLVLDFSALRKQVKGTLGAWEKELTSGAIFFSDKRLEVVVKGRPERIAMAAALLTGLIAQARKALPAAHKGLIKAAGPMAGKLLDEVNFALKNLAAKSKGDTLSVRLDASPLRSMTAAGMLAYFMLARDREPKAVKPRKRK